MKQNEFYNDKRKKKLKKKEQTPINSQNINTNIIFKETKYRRIRQEEKKRIL